jgi:peroxiredoxin Q/BCP
MILSVRSCEGQTMQTGDLVPDFTLDDQDGTPRTLSVELAKGPIVLFFYPAAMTSGCTKEACHFRDLGSEFAAVGAQRFGISFDGVDKQKQFADLHTFDYPLLSDADLKVAEIFGVKRGALSFLTKVKRATFVIGTDQRIKAVFSSETKMDAHADQALAVLKAS